MYAINKAEVSKGSIKNECFHCGGNLPNKPYTKDAHYFCCKGCVSVYTILKDSGLETIYDNTSFGNFSKPTDEESVSEFELLENTAIQEKIISFREGNICKVLLYAPAIHCASCIWLLEHLPQLHPAVIQSQVNFHSKKISILFDNSKISLKDLAILLTQIGYKPHFSLSQKDQGSEHKMLLLRLGVAGFAFGNIMLLSFPDYLDTLSTLETQYANFFHYVSFVLSLPVLMFSAYPYLKSAWSGIKSMELNMDIPIGIGIFTLFFRSTYDVFFLHESGYFDSFSGFIFFLLIGRWYQHKTYQFLDFEKSFHSFFPISVIKIENLNEVVKEVKDIQKNDLVKLRNGELIPFDGVLLSEEAQIDYSFVTGESELFHKHKGDSIYAGGRLVGKKIIVQVKKPFDQQYFIQLWNENTDRKNHSFKKLSSFLGKLITFSVLTVAGIAIFYWKDAGIQTVIKNVTSILIIGCSCAFALSAPFLFGNVSRLLAKLSFYIKNTDSIATMAKIQHVILDKTGTLTEKNLQVQWAGNKELNTYEKAIIYATLQNSIHPLSKKICNLLQKDVEKEYDCSYYQEFPGKGIYAIVNGHSIRIGSKEWLEMPEIEDELNSVVCVEMDGIKLGYFSIANALREGLENLNELKNKGYFIHILTGDNALRTQQIQKVFADNIKIFTNQKPEDKKAYILRLQNNTSGVMMIGDGLNDVPALKTADFGVSITDDMSFFVPSGDAIMKGECLMYLPNILHFAKTSYRLLIVSYIFSFIYNSIGLTLAFNGYLTPIVAALFMPLSSISVVLFAIISTNYFARKYKIVS